MVYVSPAYLGSVWWFVQAGLWKIRKRCREPWTPEHVRTYLQDGRAGLYLRPEGFIVLRTIDEEFSGTKYLHVWAAWFRPGYAKKHRQELIAWLDKRREELCCAWISMGSPRKGWIALEPDFRHVSSTWRRSI